MTDLNFPVLLDTGESQNVTNYRSTDGQQSENISYLKNMASNTYAVIKTVGAGRTFYLSAFIFAADGGAKGNLATGAGGSEVDFIGLHCSSGNYPTQILMLQSPIKLQSGTIISCTGTIAETEFTLIGWEE